MSVRSTRSVKSKSRSRKLTPAALENLVEERAEAIVHRHNLMDLKLALALVVVGIASMAMNVLAKSNANLSLAAVTSTPSVVSTSTGKLIVSPKIDLTTISKILVPSTQPVQVAKWSVSAVNEPVRVERVRFNMINGNYSVRTTAAEFGTFSLYGDDLSTVLAQTMPVLGMGKGYVEFSGLSLTIQPGQPQTLSLRATINGSGIMQPNSMVRFGVNSSAMSYWKGVGVNSNYAVIGERVVFEPTTYSIGAPTQLNLFHNSAPVVTAGTINSGLTLSDVAPIFKFTVTNPGDRQLRISKLLLNTHVSGLKNSGPTSTGYIKSFKLYDANSSGNMGTELATANNCVTSPSPTGPKTGTVSIPGAGTCSLGTVYVTFDQKNDLPGLFDNLIVEVGSSRTFILAANTNNMLVGLTASGEVAVDTKISGNTGTFPSSDPKVPFWGGGGIFYHYQPMNGKENLTAYNQSDSYPVFTQALSRKF